MANAGPRTTGAVNESTATLAIGGAASTTAKDMTRARFIFSAPVQARFER